MVHSHCAVVGDPVPHRLDRVVGAQNFDSYKWGRPDNLPGWLISPQHAYVRNPKPGFGYLHAQLYARPNSPRKVVAAKPNRENGLNRCVILFT